MKYLIIVMCLMCVGCVTRVNTDGDIKTTISSSEILVEWEASGLHYRFWLDNADMNSNYPKYKISLLHERPDGYVNHYSETGYWDENMRVNSNPWKK